MRSFIVPVVVEADDQKWRAYVPDLESRGAATWGDTQEEALRNIQEVVQMVIEELIADGETLPESVRESERPAIAVTV